MVILGYQNTARRRLFRRPIISSLLFIIAATGIAAFYFRNEIQLRIHRLTLQRRCVEAMPKGPLVVLTSRQEDFSRLNTPDYYRKWNTYRWYPECINPFIETIKDYPIPKTVNGFELTFIIAAASRMSNAGIARVVLLEGSHGVISWRVIRPATWKSQAITISSGTLWVDGLARADRITTTIDSSDARHIHIEFVVQPENKWIDGWLEDDDSLRFTNSLGETLHSFP